MNWYDKMIFFNIFISSIFHLFFDDQNKEYKEY